MQFNALLAVFASCSLASAAALPAADNSASLLEARSCPAGDYHTGSRAGPAGGCAWYYCNGNTYQLWIDCGPRGSCTTRGGRPACD